MNPFTDQEAFLKYPATGGLFNGKTRIAPTPSGFLHVGNILSFAITAALAQKYNAGVLLRIDDIDRQRAAPDYIDDIFDTLNFLNIPWTEGPSNPVEFDNTYSQPHRMRLYNGALDQLRDGSHVFACNCSRSSQQIKPCDCRKLQIPLDTPDVSWRFITTHRQATTFKGLNSDSIQMMLPLEMHNFIIKKKDGFPAYQLTSVIDDLHFNINMVIRGEDLLPSTLAQLQVAIALGENSFREIAFYHHPLMKDASGNKLSKSLGATSIKYLRGQGKTPADIFSGIAEMAGIKEEVENWQQLGVAFGDYL